ncbi:probable G-protein coupled receptor Mth-like 3 isoform X2 [Rhodnius prolixus]|uniref:probable G-protein coupled receptor Mth-like 3 isoform X2 n=1 Tax=Rhodnius prolixus TaxID=13249 RepID=UPI003D188807
MRMLVILTLFIPKILTDDQCCPSGVYLGKGACSDGTNISIGCGRDSYLVTSADGELEVEEGILHILGEEDNFTIAKNSFCMGVDEFTKKRVALVCFEEDASYLEKVGFMKIYSICLLISDLFLVITLIVYMAFPTLRDLQGKSLMSFTACLCLGYFLLAIMQLEYFGFYISTEFCLIMGFILYYLLMSSFFWLSVISFNIWRSASWQITWSDAQLGIAYNVIGFGSPAIFLIAAILAHHTPGNHIKPDFSKSCWFSGKSETWAFFYGPIGILLCFNIVFFALTVMRLWKDYKDSNPGSRIQVLRFKCLLYLKVFLTMGISWIFEIGSYIFELDIWHATDIVNCLQGVIIFIVMVATRRRVIRLIASNGLFSNCFNTNWQTIKDEESENDVQAEQIQLS